MAPMMTMATTPTNGVAGREREQRERGQRQQRRAAGEPVQPVGEIDRVRDAEQEQRRQRQRQPFGQQVPLRERGRADASRRPRSSPAATAMSWPTSFVPGAQRDAIVPHTERQQHADRRARYAGIGCWNSPDSASASIVPAAIAMPPTLRHRRRVHLAVTRERRENAAAQPRASAAGSAPSSRSSPAGSRA